MIPLEYRLRECARVECQQDGTWLVISGSPLCVLKVNRAAASLLEHCRDGASIAELAGDLGLEEERILGLCERFRSRGILEVRRVPMKAGGEPSVSIVVPVMNQADVLDGCLAALRALEYPRGRCELIVVDDGSADPAPIAAAASRHGARLLVNEGNRGPSYSRNRAAAETQSEVLAFIDSDCVASRDWLLQLVPYLSWERVGAVGGRTFGYHSRTMLDRYEAAASPLDMGERFRIKERGADTFYVPTCNLLVRRALFIELGGLREDLRLGEDVDFCWRLRAGGYYLVYAPEGVVRHKHRGELGAMLRRRLEYGTSEAKLYSLHPDKRKHLPWEPAPLVTTVLLSAAVLSRRSLLAVAALLPGLWDGVRRSRHLRQVEAGIGAEQAWLSVARGHLSLLYFAYFHLVRYYLGPMVAAGILSRGARRLSALALTYAGSVDYITKQPRLSYLSYLACYLAEHAAYQAGVIAGCMREGTFRSYQVGLQRDRSARGLAR